MAYTVKNIMYRSTIIAVFMLLVAVAIVLKLINIQLVNGEKYRKRAEMLTTRSMVIPAERGTIFADDGDILSSTTSKYDIFFDAVTVPKKLFTDKNVQLLADSLSVLLDKPASYYSKKLKRARVQESRYVAIAKKISYPAYSRIKQFPIFNKFS